MNRFFSSSVGLLLSGFLATAVYSAQNGPAIGQEATKSGQELQKVQPPPPDKAKLSKRNQAKIKQTEAAKAKNEKIKPKTKLSKRNQARIEQAEAAKKKQELIDKANADKPR